jgi:hypothetical protein
MKKFKPAKDNRRNESLLDEPGTVVVSIYLAGTGYSRVPGTIQRRVRLDVCRVSDVYIAVLESVVDGGEART